MTLAEGTFTGLAGQEVELFEKLLSGLSGEGVEIGSLDGYSAAVILGCSNLNLTAIDPFIPDSMNISLIGSQDRFWKNVDPWKSRITLRVDYSWNVSPTWSKEIDFLFIDGDHTYESCRRDFKEWTRFLKKGGILALHDSRMYRPGGAHFHIGSSNVAQEYVYNCPSDWEVIGEAFSLTVARKK